jgi:hypothetical protein
MYHQCVHRNHKLGLRNNKINSRFNGHLSGKARFMGFYVMHAMCVQKHEKIYFNIFKIIK